MKHLGDITTIDWLAVEPVDVVTGGSPCQDLSVAGKRAGLAGERSGLYMEQIKCVKELREADVLRGRTGEFIRPRYMVWENVPGAFSSGKPKGADFAAVIEEIIKVAEQDAYVCVLPPSGGWTKSGCYYDRDGRWSIAWRVHDAQFWGVPQRRKRISLVADFGGLSAPEILFERKGLRGNFEESGTPRKATTGDAEESAGADDCERAVGLDGYNATTTGNASATLGVNCGMSTGRNGVIECFCDQDMLVYSVDQGGGKGALVQTDKSATLATNNDQYLFQPIAFAQNQRDEVRDLGDKAGALQAEPGMKQQTFVAVVCKTYDARGNGDGEVVNTLTGDHNNRITDYSSVVVEEAPVYCLQGNGIDRADTAGCNGKGWKEDVGYTLNTIDRPAVAYLASGKDAVGTLMASMATKQCLGDQEAFSGDYHIIEGKNVEVFRQGGFADYVEGEVGTLRAAGGDYGGGTENLLVEHPAVHYIVRRLTPLECERLQGFPDGWTDIGDWVDSKGKKHKAADSPRYKALGNSIALPFWCWLAKRISAQYERDITVGSLFDGIGGFPYAFEKCGGKALWASEIEEYPIAVTKIRFPEENANDRT